MSASRIFIQLAVAAMMGSVLTIDNPNMKCFDLFDKGHFCPKKTRTIHCVTKVMELEKGKALWNITKAVAKKCREYFEKEIKIIKDLCMRHFYTLSKTTDCVRGTTVLECFERKTRYYKTMLPGYWSEMHKPLSKLQKYYCEDCKIMNREVSNDCKASVEYIMKKYANKTKSDCFRDQKILDCFERLTPCYPRSPGDWSTEHEELSERMKTTCAASG